MTDQHAAALHDLRAAQALIERALSVLGAGAKAEESKRKEPPTIGRNQRRETNDGDR